MNKPTTFLFARPRLWCRLFGHSFRIAFTERTYGSPFKAVPVAVVKYKECRCCPTRMAEAYGEPYARNLDFTWLREKFDGSKN